MHDIDRNLTEYGEEMENAPFQSYETENDGYESEEPPFNEMDEMALTSQLMELETEEEFDRFLGDLIKKAANAVGGYINAQTGQSLGSLLKGAARQILPVVTQAIGGETGEMEGEDPYGGELEAEEQEWEAANTFVKLAGEASKIASQSPPDSAPTVVADQAVTQAANIHAPALVDAPPPQPAGPPMRGGFARVPRMRRRRQGRWVRRGNQIILYGV